MAKKSKDIPIHENLIDFYTGLIRAQPTKPVAIVFTNVDSCYAIGHASHKINTLAFECAKLHQRANEKPAIRILDKKSFKRMCNAYGHTNTVGKHYFEINGDWED